MTAPAVFSLGRGVMVTGAVGATAPDDLKIAHEDKFLSSSHESWASGDPNALTTGITEYKAGRDIKGPIPVASEIDFAPASNPHIPLQQMTRLVGIGSTRVRVESVYRDARESRSRGEPDQRAGG